MNLVQVLRVDVPDAEKAVEAAAPPVVKRRPWKLWRRKPRPRPSDEPREPGAWLSLAILYHEAFRRW